MGITEAMPSLAERLFPWKYSAMLLVNHIYQATALGPGAQHSLNFEVLHECITVRFLSHITKKV